MRADHLDGVVPAALAQRTYDRAQRRRAPATGVPGDPWHHRAV